MAVTIVPADADESGLWTKRVQPSISRTTARAVVTDLEHFDLGHAGRERGLRGPAYIAGQ
jgi:hypothetical protein